MDKILFACDLDNTLIHSKKHREENDVCVEWIDGKEQSYMSLKTIELLKKVCKAVEFLPVTSRSVQQYLRICWPDGCKPRYALTTNGGILLENDKVDSGWLEQSVQEVEPYQAEYQQLLESMQQSNSFLKCRTVDELYLFGYCKSLEESKNCQARYSEETSLYVMSSGYKLYIFPAQLQKGEGVKRFMKARAFDTLYSAGDSGMDISMLALADVSFVPNADMKNAYVGKEQVVCPAQMKFSLFIVEEILRRKLQNG